MTPKDAGVLEMDLMFLSMSRLKQASPKHSRSNAYYSKTSMDAELNARTVLWYFFFIILGGYVIIFSTYVIIFGD